MDEIFSSRMSLTNNIHTIKFNLIKDYFSNCNVIGSYGKLVVLK